MSSGEAYGECSSAEDGDGSAEQVKVSKIFCEWAVDEHDESARSAAYDTDAGGLPLNFECWSGGWFGDGFQFCW